MNRKKWLGVLCAVIVVAALIIGFLHKGGQEETAGIVLIQGDSRIEISLEDLQQESFSGETVNGKGEHFEHEYEGVALYDLLEDNGIDPAGVTEVEVRAADQYAATVTGEEVCEKDRIYLAVTEDGAPVEGIEEGAPGAEMVVFGDSDSKRCVRCVVEVEAR